ncbi:MAG: metal-dependent transcriptional regulator [bacterium]
MKLNDRAEEILESLWVHDEKKPGELMDLGVAKDNPEIEDLIKSGFIKLAANKLILTERGANEGRKIVRRHRLAERLFTDVLDIKKKLVHPVSCQFEHLLQEGIEDDICVLLGHPKTCPHGKLIPQGDCCRKSREEVKKIISPLSDLEVNGKGKVAYIYTKDHPTLHKLMAMGVLPGMNITLIQKFPSYVFKIGQSQFAVDKELASVIYVRITK